MRQVDACDFCGDAPDGVFEVVPAALPDGPVRFALCTDCRTTLETVVDPLLAADQAATESSRSEGAESADRSAGAESGVAADPDTDDAAEAAPNTPTAMREPPDEGGADDDTAAESGDDGGVTIEQQGGGTPAERPDGYAQVIRLLENRDGGMPRGDLRALATNAYDLTDRTFEAAVDAAVENGDVAEGADGLRRT
jgi:hypothetical protein